MDMSIPKTILSQLQTLGKVKVWSWGSHAWKGGENFLEFKVQGFKLKGRVRITLMGDDTYTITYFKGRQPEPYKTTEGVYFDEMVDLIDEEIEYTGTNYEKDVKSAIYKI